jgi:hypothetical protein
MNGNNGHEQQNGERGERFGHRRRRRHRGGFRGERQDFAGQDGGEQSQPE